LPELLDESEKSVSGESQRDGRFTDREEDRDTDVAGRAGREADDLSSASPTVVRTSSEAAPGSLMRHFRGAVPSGVPSLDDSRPI
jgi:hypothetical protein